MKMTTNCIDVHVAKITHWQPHDARDESGIVSGYITLSPHGDGYVNNALVERKLFRNLIFESAEEAAQNWLDMQQGLWPHAVFAVVPARMAGMHASALPDNTRIFKLDAKI